MAAAASGGDLSAEAVRRLPLIGLRMAETASRPPDDDPHDSGPDFWIGSVGGSQFRMLSLWPAGAAVDLDVVHADGRRGQRLVGDAPRVEVLGRP